MSKISGFKGSRAPSRSVRHPQDAASDGTSADVRIAGSARELAVLEQALRDLLAVNETRVAQIGQAIGRGTYTVHPREIADRLIQLERALADLPCPVEPDSTEG